MCRCELTISLGACICRTAEDKGTLLIITAQQLALPCGTLLQSNGSAFLEKATISNQLLKAKRI